MALTVVTAPTVEPVSLAEAKLQCRVDISADDALITALIVAAREMAETITRRALITQTWDWVLDAFPQGDRLEIPMPPLQSVTSITYVDQDEASDTVSSDDYVVDTDGEPGRVVLKSSATWPSVTLRVANGVAVRFVAGYGDAASDVPQAIRQAMLLTIGHWYENREDSVGVGNIQRIPIGATSLLWPYRVLRFP
jgi:uncharacterized phiE125 gp8 family phage protein